MITPPYSLMKSNYLEHYSQWYIVYFWQWRVIFQNNKISKFYKRFLVARYDFYFFTDMVNYEYCMRIIFMIYFESTARYKKNEHEIKILKNINHKLYIYFYAKGNENNPIFTI